MIEEYIIRAFAEYRIQNKISLRRMEREIGIPFQDISRMESLKKQPTKSFLLAACRVISNSFQQ